MKNKIFIVAAILFAGIIGINAQPNVELKNPTTNNEFNTNATPFNEKRTEGLRENYNQFGNERRNINVKSSSYEHYNQTGSQKSILGNQENVVVNRPQSATLNNNQYNYGNQNAGRKVDNTNRGSNVRYNAPMSVEQINATLTTTTSDEEIIEIGDQQNIKIGAGGVVDPNTLPKTPYKQPIGNAIPFIVMLAGVYAFILRRKQ